MNAFVGDDISEFVFDAGVLTSRKTVAPSNRVPEWVCLPPLWDWHCHLDKTFMGSAWQSRQPVNTIIEALENENILRCKVTTDGYTRALALAVRKINYGITAMRTHADVDGVLGASQVEILSAIRDSLAERASIEIVAFPQQGLWRSQSYRAMREALERGAHVVGAIDPISMDGDLEKSLATTFDMATEYSRPVDLHLHDGADAGVQTIQKLCELTRETRMGGAVVLSHGYVLGTLEKVQLRDILDDMADAHVTWVTSVPLHRPLPPVACALQRQVTVRMGTDNVQDAWSPFGSGDVMEKLSRVAEIMHWTDDDRLTRALTLVTNGQTQIPERDFVLVKATTMAEVIAQYPTTRIVVRQGQVVGSVGLCLNDGALLGVSGLPPGFKEIKGG